MGDFLITVTDVGGNYTVAHLPVTVTPLNPVVAAFTLNFHSGVAPLTVRLTQTCQAADHYQVTWGDGSTGIVHPLSDSWADHVYAVAGNYHIDLRAWRDDGTEAHATDDVMVNLPPSGGLLGRRYGGISEPLARSTNSMGEATLDRWAAEIATLGMGWVRADYPVASISPSRGTYNYAAAGHWIEEAVEHGLKPLPIIYMLPSWMNGSGNDKAPPTNLQDYADWCGHVAPHLEDIGVEWVEIWNEQNLSGFWPAPSRVVYADLFKRAADAIHAASNLKVITGGISTADTQYQSGVRGVPGYTSPEVGCYCSLDCYGYLGALDHADGIGFHPYLDGYDPSPTGEGTWCEWTGNSVRRAIAICDRWSPGRHLTIWNTESAAPRSAMSETEQANRAAHAFEAFDTWTLADGSPMRSRLGPYFWFTLRDWNDAAEARARTFGLEYPDWSHHQAYASVQSVLARNLPA